MPEQASAEPPAGRRRALVVALFLLSLVFAIGVGLAISQEPASVSRDAEHVTCANRRATLETMARALPRDGQILSPFPGLLRHHHYNRLFPTPLASNV